MVTIFKNRFATFPKPPFSHFYQPILALIIILLSLQFSFGQINTLPKPGLIYKPAASVLGKKVLDFNGDSYVSASSTGFLTNIDDGDKSELNMVPLPVMIAEPPADLSTGASGGHTDLVSNTINHSCYILYKTVDGVNYLIVRFRIGKASTATKGYSLLFDTDNTFGSQYTGNPGFEKELVLETGNNGKIAIYTHSEGSTVLSHFYTIDDFDQRSVAASNISDDPDYFYDFFVPYADLELSTTVRMSALSITSAGSGITGTHSDVDGVKDSDYGNSFTSIMKALIGASPVTNMTNMVSGATFAPIKCATPVVNGNITTASTSITGTSTEADGTYIQVYKGGVAFGSPVQVLNNAWTLSTGVTGNLATGNLITAKASISGKTDSDISSSVEVTGVQSCYTAAPVILSSANGTQTVTGTWSGSVVPDGTNVVITLFEQTATGTFVSIPIRSGTCYVQLGGGWDFQTSALQADFGKFNGFVAQATIGTCTSKYSNSDVNGNSKVAATPAPSLTPTTLNPSNLSTSITVTNNGTGNVANTTLNLYVNNTLVQSAPNIAAGGFYTFSYSGLIEGDIVSATAQGPVGGNPTYTVSGESNKVTVTGAAGQTATPVITGNYVAGSGITVTGTSTEPAGTVIYLYKAGSTLLNTAIVNAFGQWSVTGLTLAAADALTAKADATGKTLSTASSPAVIVAASAPGAPVISGSYSAGATSIAGTSGNGTVTVYVDGSSIGTTTAVGGAWSLGSIATNQLYKGAVITATNTVGGVESALSAPVTVTGIGSYLITNTSGGAIGTQTAGVPFDIKVTAMSGAGGTGSVITTYTGKATLSSDNSIVTTGSGETIPFTLGVLSPKSMVLTTAGDDRTINAISTTDPTVTGSTTLKVVAAAPTTLEINSPADIPAGTRAPYTITRKDQYGNLVTSGAQTFYLTSTGTGAVFYDAAIGGNTETSLVIPDGSSSANFWFTSQNAGGYTITASDATPANGGNLDVSDPITVTASTASQYIVTRSAPSAYVGGNVTVSAQLVDQYGNPVTTSGITANWTASNGGTFSPGTSSLTNSSGIATITYNVANSVGNISTVTATSTGPSITGTSGNITTVANPPSTQASNITFSGTTATQTGISWTNGNGAGRVVFVKQTASSTPTTVANNTSYTANTAYLSGTPNADGWYCVYNGTGSTNTVTVTGLSPALPYEVQVFEYNGTAGSGIEQYNNSVASNNPMSVTTKSNNANLTNLVPSVGSISPTFAPGTTSYTEGVANGVTSITVTPTHEESNATITVNGVAVTSGSASGSLPLSVGPNTITTVVTAQDGTTKTYTLVVTRAAAVPDTQATNVIFPAVGSTSMQIDFTAGTGAKRVVFVKQTASAETTTPVNGTNYTASTTFTGGTQIATGWYCVYNGSGTSVTVSGLSPATAYEVQVFDYNGGTNLEVYNPNTATGNPANQVTKSTNANLSNLTSSSGALSPVFGVNTLSYTTPDVAYAVTSATITPTHEEPNSTITVNGVATTSGSGQAVSLNVGENVIPVVVTAQDGTTIKTYNITINRLAPVAPTTQATNILFSNVGPTSMQIDWTNGNGTNRVVFIKQASAGVAAGNPVDNTTYAAGSSVYNSGTQIGGTGWYCIYSGSGSSPITVTGLTALTDYTIEVFEYNGGAGVQKYDISSATGNPSTQKTDNPLNSWTGLSVVDSQWNTPENWNLIRVPLATDNVDIPNGRPRYPEISDVAACKNLTIQSGGSDVLKPSVTVMPTGQFNVGGNITNNRGVDGMIIKSTIVGTGSMKVAGTVIGLGTVERYMSDAQWYLMSAPADQKVRDFITYNYNIPYWALDKNHPEIKTDMYGMAPYNTLLDVWETYFSDSNLREAVGEVPAGINYNRMLGYGNGFKIRTIQDPAYVDAGLNIITYVTFKGVLNVGQKTVQVRKSNNNSWNCVGNPFTSAICLNTAASTATGASENFLSVNLDTEGDNSKAIDKNFGSIYFWNDKRMVLGVKVPGYETVNLASSAAYAQVGQAFFIKGTLDANHVHFNPTMQVHQPSLELKASSVAYPEIQLVATLNSTAALTSVKFIDGTSKGLDVGYDAGMFKSDPNFAIYTKLVEDNGVNFQLQCLPTNQYRNLEIPIGVESKTGGDVVFSALGTNLEAGCKMILEDRLTHTFTDLSTNTYKAAVTANTATSDRFFLHTSDIVSAIGDQELANGKITAFAVRNVEIRVIGEVSERATATLYNSLGQAVVTKVLSGGSLNMIGLPNLSSGVYMLNINDNGKVQTIKVMVRK